MKASVLQITLFTLLTVAAAAQSQPTADLIITDANIWTVDPGHPTAEAVAWTPAELPTKEMIDPVMVILSDDIFTIDPVKIREVTVLKTFLGGELIYGSR
jgi:hypothetical protein